MLNKYKSVEMVIFFCTRTAFAHVAAYTMLHDIVKRKIELLELLELLGPFELLAFINRSEYEKVFRRI